MEPAFSRPWFVVIKCSKLRRRRMVDYLMRPGMLSFAADRCLLHILAEQRLQSLWQIFRADAFERQPSDQPFNGLRFAKRLRQDR